MAAAARCDQPTSPSWATGSPRWVPGSGRGRREIDADGLIVTPGFVDPHTHYDGQATWDPVLAPSAHHGVTTVAMGNCGVGFAPVAPDRHQWLIEMMEGVEDIPGTALHEGLRWDWGSFPEYLDALERQPRTIDVGTHLPHAALRAFVMGERGADPALHPDDAELDLMAKLLEQSLDAGAVGVSTSRTERHRTSTGENLGTLRAREPELLALASVLRESGRGVFQFLSDSYRTTDDEFARQEFELVTAFARASRRPVSYTVQQDIAAPERWRDLMRLARDLRAEGLDVKAQVAPRPIGLLLGLEASVNVFTPSRAYGKIAGLPIGERIAAMRDHELRRRILEGHAHLTSGPDAFAGYAFFGRFDDMYVLDDPVDYDLDSSRSLGATAHGAGVDPAEYAYDVQLQRDGAQLIYTPLFNFAHGDLDAVHEMISSPVAMFGLSDAGAHCGQICDGEHDHHLPVAVGARPAGARRDAHRSGGAPDQRTPGGPLRLARPGCRRPRLPGRSEHHRPRPPRVRAAGDRRRPAGRRAPAPAGRPGLPVDGETGRGDLRRRRAHRRAPREAGPRCSGRSGRGPGLTTPDVLSAFLDHADAGPDRPAAKDLERDLSYRELRDDAAAVAAGLAALGVEEGDRVALLLPNSVDFVVAALACLWIGAIFVPLAVTDPVARLSIILGDCEPTVVVTPVDPEDGGAAPSSIERVRTATLPELRSQVGAQPEPARISARAAYAIYTSGTTGTPKGVLIGNRAFARAVAASAEALGLGAGTRTLCVSPFHFDGSFGTLFPTLFSGGAIVMRPREALLFPRTFFNAVKQEAITYTGFSPSYLRLLLSSPEVGGLGGTTLEVVALGGEACAASDIRSFWDAAPQVEVFNRYGPTETTIAVTHMLVTPESIGDGTVSIGQPHPGVSFHLIDADGALVDSPDRIGELYIGGCQLMDGYWGAPELTAEAMRTDVVRGETVYRTGDLVYRTAKGDYVYVDRADRVIKRQGVRISLVELGDAILALPGVSAATCAAFDDDGRTGIVAFAVTDGRASALDLRRAAGDRLPESMLPDRIELVDEPATHRVEQARRAQAPGRGRSAPAPQRFATRGPGRAGRLTAGRLCVGHDPPRPRPELPVLDHRVPEAEIELLAHDRRLEQ